MKKLTISIKVLICFSMLSSANAWADWTGKQTLLRIYTSASSIYVKTDPVSAHINPDGCSSNSHYRLDPDLVMFEKHYEMIVTAIAANRQISLNLTDCLGSYPRIAGVILY